jgi:hypothetical protein
MGFFDFLKKSGAVKDDAKDLPLDEDEQQRQLSDPDNKIEHTPRDDDAEDSNSYGE